MTLHRFRHPEKEDESNSVELDFLSWLRKKADSPAPANDSALEAEPVLSDDELVEQEPPELVEEPAIRHDRAEWSPQEGNAATAVAENIDELDDDEAYSLGQPVHMIVSSKHLIKVSDSFKAMLRSKYGKFEGVEILRSQGRITVTLPDDDADAFIVLLNIIHGSMKKVSRRVNLELLTKFTILAMKHQMLEVTETFSDMWIKELAKKTLPETYTPEIFPWLYIA